MNKEDEEKEIAEKLKEIGFNENTFNLLFSDYKDYLKNDDKRNTNSAIITIIELYTQTRENFLSKIRFKHRTRHDYSEIKFNEKTKLFEFNYKGETYAFDKLSRVFGDKATKRELESKKRYRKCHEKTVEISVSIPEANILTGYVRRFDGKYLHSVVEIGKDGNKRIIDYTKNIIMPKEQYMKLTDFELMEKNTDIEYIENMKIISKIPVLENIPPVNLTFGKEIAKDLKKNGSVFNEDPELDKAIDDLIRLKLELRKNDKEEER